MAGVQDAPKIQKLLEIKLWSNIASTIFSSSCLFFPSFITFLSPLHLLISRFLPLICLKTVRTSFIIHQLLTVSPRRGGEGGVSTWIGFDSRPLFALPSNAHYFAWKFCRPFKRPLNLLFCQTPSHSRLGFSSFETVSRTAKFLNFLHNILFSLRHRRFL